MVCFDMTKSCFEAVELIAETVAEQVVEAPKDLHEADLINELPSDFDVDEEDEEV